MNKPMNEFPLLKPEEGVVLFYPDINSGAIESVKETLEGRWIGQGPKVELFESEFSSKFLEKGRALAVGSGTDALHLSYLMAGIQKGDEVIVPVFTCTATNIPLLYIGAKIVFCDIDPLTMNLSIEDLKRKISKNTKAIVTVDYGGICCDYDAINEIARSHGIPVIQDAAHSIGSKYDGSFVGNQSDYTIFSFQAIKTLTTGDGGMVAVSDICKVPMGKRLRWFGIDRDQKQAGIWENDIKEIGFKYQMNDISAAIGLSNLKFLDQAISYRKELFKEYVQQLSGLNGISIVKPVLDKSQDFCPWLMTILVDRDRVGLMSKLRENKIESAQVHYRNDRYSIFKEFKSEVVNMDQLEEKYLVLPLHHKVSIGDIAKIKEIIKGGW